MSRPSRGRAYVPQSEIKLEAALRRRENTCGFPIPFHFYWSLAL